jgi:excinuclease ABC subunit B
MAYNELHGIKPKTIVKAVEDLEEFQTNAKREGLRLLRDAETPLTVKDLPAITEEIENRMKAAADALDFEQATVLRDQLFELRSMSASRAKSKASARRQSKASPRPKI